MTRHAYSFMLALFAIVMLAACVSTPTPTVMPSESITAPTRAVNPTHPPATPTPRRVPELQTAMVRLSATSVPLRVLPTQVTIDAGVDSRAWLSPDGKWIVMSVNVSASGVAYMYQQLKVVRVVNGADERYTTEWTLVDDWAPDGLGASYPSIFAWSPNGQYVYYADFASGDGCPVVPSVFNVRRLRLTDGQVEHIRFGIDWPLTLSPDGKTLAHGGLTLLDLETQVERHVPLTQEPHLYVGGMQWSPDGTRLVLVLMKVPPDDPCPSGRWRYSIVRVDSATLESKTLIHEDPRRFYIVEWQGNRRVLLKNDTGQTWWMDAETGELTEVK